MCVSINTSNCVIVNLYIDVVICDTDRFCTLIYAVSETHGALLTPLVIDLISQIQMHTNTYQANGYPKHTTKHVSLQPLAQSVVATVGLWCDTFTWKDTLLQWQISGHNIPRCFEKNSVNQVVEFSCQNQAYTVDKAWHINKQHTYGWFGYLSHTLV